MIRFKTKLRDGGRVVIPAEYRKAIEIKVGDEVIMVLKEGERKAEGAGQ